MVSSFKKERGADCWKRPGACKFGFTTTLKGLSLHDHAQVLTSAHHIRLAEWTAVGSTCSSVPARQKPNAGDGRLEMPQVSASPFPHSPETYVSF